MVEEVLECHPLGEHRIGLAFGRQLEACGGGVDGDQGGDHAQQSHLLSDPLLGHASRYGDIRLVGQSPIDVPSSSRAGSLPQSSVVFL